MFKLIDRVATFINKRQLSDIRSKITRINFEDDNELDELVKQFFNRFSVISDYLHSQIEKHGRFAGIMKFDNPLLIALCTYVALLCNHRFFKSYVIFDPKFHVAVSGSPSVSNSREYSNPHPNLNSGFTHSGNSNSSGSDDKLHQTQQAFFQMVSNVSNKFSGSGSSNNSNQNAAIVSSVLEALQGGDVEAFQSELQRLSQNRSAMPGRMDISQIQHILTKYMKEAEKVSKGNKNTRGNGYHSNNSNSNNNNNGNFNGDITIMTANTSANNDRDGRNSRNSSYSQPTTPNGNIFNTSNSNIFGFAQSYFNESKNDDNTSSSDEDSDDDQDIDDLENGRYRKRKRIMKIYDSSSDEDSGSDVNKEIGLLRRKEQIICDKFIIPVPFDENMIYSLPIKGSIYYLKHLLHFENDSDKETIDKVCEKHIYLVRLHYSHLLYMTDLNAVLKSMKFKFLHFGMNTDLTINFDFIQYWFKHFKMLNTNIDVAGASANDRIGDCDAEFYKYLQFTHSLMIGQFIGVANHAKKQNKTTKYELFNLLPDCFVNAISKLDIQDASYSSKKENVDIYLNYSTKDIKNILTVFAKCFECNQENERKMTNNMLQYIMCFWWHKVAMYQNMNFIWLTIVSFLNESVLSLDSDAKEKEEKGNNDNNTNAYSLDNVGTAILQDPTLLLMINDNKYKQLFGNVWFMTVYVRIVHILLTASQQFYLMATPSTYSIVTYSLM